MADDKEKNLERGIFSEDSSSESENEENSESENEQSQSSDHDRQSKNEKIEESKSDPPSNSREEEKVDVVSAKLKHIETPVKLKNSSLQSEISNEDDESKCDESSRPKRKTKIEKSPNTNRSKNSKMIKRKLPQNSILSAKPKFSKIINPRDEQSLTSSENFIKNDSLRISNQIKSIERKKLTSYLQEIALIKTKLANVLKEKFKATDLAAEENSLKIIGDLELLMDLYANKIDDNVSVNTLCKTGISKTLHRFHRY